ncbi:MAG: DNA replication/repair protein RecF [Lachnospiraceae bacterium]|nr:DNA replication/repair protein RecF [Lachnospiraceae bacterium]
MHIKSLEVKDLRNLKTSFVEFSERTNIFYGDNAQGKTNILEALYLCSMVRSHRTNTDSELINFDKSEAHICLKYVRNDVDHKIDMHLRRNGLKGLALDGVPVRKSSEFIGSLSTVFFSPEDLSIIKSGPSKRRRFMDMQICQINPVYLKYLAKYNKIIEQRNSLLKQISSENKYADTLDVLDEQLSFYGGYIIDEREKYTEDLNGIIKNIHSGLTDGKEILQLTYEKSSEKSGLLKDLLKKRDTDIRSKTTSTGPHRDDMGVWSNDIDLRRFGSQGQQRSAALSLKLSEIEMIERAKGEKPVLLLDDVLSELDTKRQDALLDRINGIQTMITCTGLDEYVKKRFKIDKLFKVENGEIFYE